MTEKEFKNLKVGDKVYNPWTDVTSGRSVIGEMEVVATYPNPLIENIVTNVGIYPRDVCFLTKEEAEKALEKINHAFDEETK